MTCGLTYREWPMSAFPPPENLAIERTLTDVSKLRGPVNAGHQNSFRSLAMNTGPEKCFFTSP